MGLARAAVLPVLLAFVCVAASGCKRYSDIPVEPRVQGQAPALGHGQFLDRELSPLGDAFVAEQAAEAAYVLVGEAHPSACDHKAQARVLELMVRAGAQPAVGLEMVSLDYQPVLELFNKGIIGVADLPGKLRWEETWGFPFELYRPVFELAREYSLPLYALNVERETARKVGRVGLKGLTREERLELPAKILPPPAQQEESLRAVFEAHHPGQGKKDSEAAWRSFVTVQSLWDTVMARRAVEVRVSTRRPVVILAGSGHVENGWGIASRLTAFDPQGKKLLVMPWRAGPAPEAGLGDIFFFCPEVRRPRLGITLDTRDDRVLVAAVEPGSRAASAGIEPGDVIASAQGEKLRVLSDLHDATMKALKEGKPLLLGVVRQAKAVELTVELPTPAPKD